ncbi:hypothetical protein ACES2L_05385 [Bdellovibrio bacteriovorus]
MQSIEEEGLYMKLVLALLSILTISSTAMANSREVRACGKIKLVADGVLGIKSQQGLLVLDASNSDLNLEQARQSAQIIDAMSIHQYVCLEGVVDSSGKLFSPLR